MMEPTATQRTATTLTGESRASCYSLTQTPILEPTAVPRTATTLTGESHASCCSLTQTPILEPTTVTRTATTLTGESHASCRNYQQRPTILETTVTSGTLTGESSALCCSKTQRPLINKEKDTRLKNNNYEHSSTETKTPSINYVQPASVDASVLQNMSKLWERFLDVPHAVLLLLAGVLVKITFLLFGISSLREVPFEPARRRVNDSSMTIPSHLGAQSDIRLNNRPIASPSNAVVPARSQRTLVPQKKPTTNRPLNAFVSSQLRAPSGIRLNNRPIASPSNAVVPLRSQRTMVPQIKSTINRPLNAFMSSQLRTPSVIRVNNRPIASPSNAVVPIRSQRPLVPQIRSRVNRPLNAFVSSQLRTPSVIRLNNRPIASPSNAVVPVRSQRTMVPQIKSTSNRQRNHAFTSSQLLSDRTIASPSNAVVPVRSQRPMVPQIRSTSNKPLNAFTSSQLCAPSVIRLNNRSIASPSNTVVPVRSQRTMVPQIKSTSNRQRNHAFTSSQLLSDRSIASPSNAVVPAKREQYLVPQIRSTFNRPLNVLTSSQLLNNRAIASPSNAVVPVKSQRAIVPHFKAIINWAIKSAKPRNESFQEESRIQVPISLTMPLEEFKPLRPRAYELMKQEQGVTETCQPLSKDAVKTMKEFDFLSPLAPKAVTISKNLPVQTYKISGSSFYNRELPVPCILEIQNVTFTLTLSMAGLGEVSERLCLVFRPECIVQVHCSNALFEACVKIMGEIGLRVPSRSAVALLSPDSSTLPEKRPVSLKPVSLLANPKLKEAGETFSEVSQERLKEDRVVERNAHSRVSSEPEMEAAPKNASIIQPANGNIPSQKDKVCSSSCSQKRSPLSPTDIKKLEEAFARLHGRKKSFTRPSASLGPQPLANEQSDMLSFSGKELLYYKKVQQLHKFKARKGQNEVRTGHSLAIYNKPKQLLSANRSRKTHEEDSSKNAVAMAAFPKAYAKASSNSTPRTNGRRTKGNVAVRDSKVVLSPPPSSILQESARPFAASFRKVNACTPCSSPSVSSIESENTQDANANEVDSSLLLIMNDLPKERKPSDGSEKEKENVFPFKEVKPVSVVSPPSSDLQSSLEVQTKTTSLESVEKVDEVKTVALEPKNQKCGVEQGSSTSGLEEGNKFAQPAQDQPSVSGLQASLEGLATALRRASSRAECAAFSFALDAEEEQDKNPSLVTGQEIAEAQSERENAPEKDDAGPAKSCGECVSKPVESTPSSGIQKSLEGLAAALKSTASTNLPPVSSASSSEKAKGQSAFNAKRTGHAHSVSLGKKSTAKPTLNVRETKEDRFAQFCKEYFKKSVGSKTVLSPPSFGLIESVNRLILANRKASLLKKNKPLGRKRSSKRRKRQKHNKKRHRKHLKTSASACNLPQQNSKDPKSVSLEKVAGKEIVKNNEMLGDAAKESKIDQNMRSSLNEAEKALEVTSDVLQTANSCLQIQIASSTANDNTKEQKQQRQRENHVKPVGNIVDEPLSAVKTSSQSMDENSVHERKTRSIELTEDPVQIALPKEFTDKKSKEVESVNSSYHPPSLREIKEAAKNIRGMFSSLFVTDEQEGTLVGPLVQEPQTGQTGYQDNSVCQPVQTAQNTNALLLQAQETDQIYSLSQHELAQPVSTVAQDPVSQMDSGIDSKTQGSSVIDEANSMVEKCVENHVAPVGEFHAGESLAMPDMEISGQFNIRQSPSGLTFHVSGDVNTSDQKLLERIQVSGNVDIQQLPSAEGLNISTNLSIIPSVSGVLRAFAKDEALALEKEARSMQSTKVQLEDVVAAHTIQSSLGEGLQQEQPLYVTQLPFVQNAHVIMAQPSEVECQVPEYLEACLLMPGEEFPVPENTDVGLSVTNEDIHLLDMDQRYKEFQASKLSIDEVEAGENTILISKQSGEIYTEECQEVETRQLLPVDVTAAVTATDVMSPPTSEVHIHVPTPLPEELGLEYRDQMPSSAAVPVASDIATQASPKEHQTCEYNVQFSRPVSAAQEDSVTRYSTSEGPRDTTTELTQKTSEVVFSGEKSTNETFLRINTPHNYSHGGVDKVVMSRAAELIERGIFLVSDSGTVDAIVHPNRVLREEGSPEMCTYSSTFNHHDVLPEQFQQKIIRSAQEEGLNNRVITAENRRLVFPVNCDKLVRGQIIEDRDGDQIMLDALQPTLSESHRQLATYLYQPCTPNALTPQLVSYHYNEPLRNDIDIDMTSDGQESLMDTTSGGNSQTSLMECEDCTDQVSGQYCRFCKEIQRQKSSPASLPTSQVLGQPKAGLMSSFEGSNERDRLAMFGFENIVQKPYEKQTQSVLATGGKQIPYSVVGNGHGFQAAVAAGCSEQTSFFNTPSTVGQPGYLNVGSTQALLSSNNNVQANDNQLMFPRSHSPTNQDTCAVQDVFTKVLPSVEGHGNTEANSAATDASYCTNPLAQNTKPQDKDSGPSNSEVTDSPLERAEGTRESEGLSPVAPSILDLCASIDIEKLLDEVPPVAKNLEDQEEHMASYNKTSSSVSDALTNDCRSDKDEEHSYHDDAHLNEKLAGKELKNVKFNCSLETALSFEKSTCTKTLKETGTSLDVDTATSLLKMNGSNEALRIDTYAGNFLVENPPYLEEKCYSSDCHPLQLVQDTSEQTTNIFVECSVANNTSPITETDLVGPKEEEEPFPKKSSDEQCLTSSNENQLGAISKQPVAPSTALTRVNEEGTRVVGNRRKFIVPRKRVLFCSADRKKISFSDLFGEDRRPGLQTTSLTGKKRLREAINDEITDAESSTQQKRRRKVRFSDEVQVYEDTLPNQFHSGSFVTKPAVPRKGILKTAKSRKPKA